MRILLALTLLLTALTANPAQTNQPMTNPASSISSPEIVSLKNDIHVLESRLQNARNRQDWWNNLYLGLGWAAVLFAMALGIGSLYSQRKASKIEFRSRPDAEMLASKNATLRDVIDRAASLEVAAAQKNAADAQERAGRAEQGAGEAMGRAAKAQASLATAEQHSAEANAKAEGFRLDIAKANEGAAHAQAQVAEANRAAAEANRIAESERLARLQLEARLADRIITPDQRARITQAFLPLRGQTIDVVIAGDTPETNRTAESILGCLQSAGVLFNFFHPMSGGGAQGVVVGIRGDAPDTDKTAGSQLIAILSETFGGGVGSADFNNVLINGTGTVGSTPGAATNGASPFRLQIAPK